MCWVRAPEEDSQHCQRLGPYRLECPFFTTKGSHRTPLGLEPQGERRTWPGFYEPRAKTAQLQYRLLIGPTKLSALSASMHSPGMRIVGSPRLKSKVRSVKTSTLKDPVLARGSTLI